MWTRAMTGARATQAERRARSRAALLEAAARGLSRSGYANLALERVAAEAGYSRGALYHQFAGKEELALAVVGWVDETWQAEVGRAGREAPDPVSALVAIARGHAVYCRRDVGRVMMVLRVEFAEQDHPVGRALAEVVGRLLADCTALVETARADGAIPPGPPAPVLTQAYVATIEAIGIALSGQPRHDADLAERATRGLLGLPVGE